MTLARVFPRRTEATPTDELAFVGDPPWCLPPGITEIHISVAFKEDRERAEKLAQAWARVGPVKIGGPALGVPGGTFVPGRYLKPGYVITSRGCPNRCWFCAVPQREGGLVRELCPNVNGWNLLDDNLLACSDEHIRAVLAMLKRNNRGRRVEFTGGLEAARLKPWHAEALFDLKPKQIFLAYDEPRDWEPLVEASRLLWEAGFSARAKRVRAYVLIGGPGDSLGEAEGRLKAVVGLGLVPHAMVWSGCDRLGWGDAFRRLQRFYARPALIGGQVVEPSGNTMDLFDLGRKPQ